MKKKNNTIMIVVALILAALFYQYSGLFTIGLQSPQVQYNNEAIVSEFTLTNFTNPQIDAFFNDKKVYTADYYTLQSITEEINGTNQTRDVKVYPALNQSYAYTYQTANGTYILKLTNVAETGVFKFVVSEGNHTETALIEVRKPYVAMKNNIEPSVDEGAILNMQVTTFNPQGNNISADRVEITMITPDNKQKELTLVKSGNLFTTTINYNQIGNYQFKIRPVLEGYTTEEFTAITSVVKQSAINPIIWIWLGAAGLFILLFIIKRIRGHK
jgi:hypothetical protein